MLKRFKYFFWIGRYVARLYTDVNKLKTYQEFLKDDRKKGTENWFSLLMNDNECESFLKHYGQEAKTNPKKIQQYMIYESKNPFSFVNIIELAKNSAEVIQTRIPNTVYESLNSLEIWIQSNEAKDQFEKNLSDFLEEIQLEIYRLEGVFEISMNRQEEYFYYRLGRTLEISLQTARVLDFAFVHQKENCHQKTNAFYWLYVLKFLQADESFLMGMETVPNDQNTGSFLLLYKLSPQSVLFNLREALLALNHLLVNTHMNRQDHVHNLLIKLVARLENLNFEKSEKIDYQAESIRILNKIFDLLDKVETDFFKKASVEATQIQQSPIYFRSAQ